MTPLPDYNTSCSGCFLYEQRGGRVCPMLDRQAQEAAEAERQDVLWALVLAEVIDAPSLIELVRDEAQAVVPVPEVVAREVEEYSRALMGLVQPALPASPTQPITNPGREALCHRLT
jgi:hypothetical protein